MLPVRRLFLFFFQAEDGIRDLVRSRGLGDVYKRQVPAGPARTGHHHRPAPDRGGRAGDRRPPEPGPGAVSYTHLTLPTSDLVLISVGPV